MKNLRFLPFFLLIAGSLWAQDTPVLTETIAEDLYAGGETPVYYSLSTNQVIPDSLKDSDAWDLSFQGVKIGVNGEAQFIDVAFDDLNEAPEAGYQTDSDEGPALPAGNREGWYFYDSSTHKVDPISDRTIVLHTKAGTYVKIEIMSYYKGMDQEEGDTRHYSFRFVIQPDGSRRF